MNNKVKCGKCGNIINYNSQPEVAMGAIKCPKCGATLNQYGKVLKESILESYLTLLYEGFKSIQNLKKLHSKLLDKQINSNRTFLNVYNELKNKGLSHDEIVKHYDFKLAQYRLSRVKHTKDKIDKVINKI